MNKSIPIIIGSSLGIILLLFIIIIFRKPNSTLYNKQIEGYKDSLISIRKVVSERDLIISKRDKTIDSINQLKINYNEQTIKNIKYIYKPNTPIKSLDSIVRALAIKPKR